MLVWVDLEMTGLDVNTDHILEIATLITDDSLESIIEGPDLVIHQPENRLSLMKEPVISMHEKNGLTAEVRKSKLNLKDAEEQTLEFIKSHIPKKYSAPLCGNTIWMDRKFMGKHFPKIDNYLHYRCVDVSSVKELVKRWHPEAVYKKPVDDKKHRAMDDILTSIEELRFYKGILFDKLSKNGLPNGMGSKE